MIQREQNAGSEDDGSTSFHQNGSGQATASIVTLAVACLMFAMPAYSRSRVPPLGAGLDMQS
jgi:hypothetical protein